MPHSRYFFLLLLTGLLLSPATAQVFWNDYEDPPHNYWRVPLQDPVTKLVNEIDRGRAPITGADEKTFLTNLLGALDVDPTSQILVFSKTSLQRRKISPQTPRAMYFNEEVYVAWVPGGFIEIISIDPTHGGIFYVIDPSESPSPESFERRSDCLGCHAGSFTEYLPGLMQASRFTDAEGRSLAPAEAHWPGHGIPFADRWGGYFVTGEHKIGAHLGNTYATREAGGIVVDSLSRSSLRDLEGEFETDLHLRPDSDVLALLLHDHQIGFANRVMEIHYRIRTPKVDTPDELADQADELLEYMLFCEEPSLGDGIQTSSIDYREWFETRAKRSPQGNSLSDFELNNHLFKNRLSYMIHSAAFAALPADFKELFYGKLHRILIAQNAPEAPFDHLGKKERQRIMAILLATREDLPADWHETVKPPRSKALTPAAKL